nr:60S ribosomal protein L24-like [Ipomoea trifida]
MSPCVFLHRLISPPRGIDIQQGAIIGPLTDCITEEQVGSPHLLGLGLVNGQAAHNRYKIFYKCRVKEYLPSVELRGNKHPEVRDAARKAALREIKERIKKTKDEKKTKKVEVMAKAQKARKGIIPKGAAPKGPKIGGGGGKR